MCIHCYYWLDDMPGQVGYPRSFVCTGCSIHTHSHPQSRWWAIWMAMAGTYTGIGAINTSYQPELFPGQMGCPYQFCCTGRPHTIYAYSYPRFRCWAILMAIFVFYTIAGPNNTSYQPQLVPGQMSSQNTFFCTDHGIHTYSYPWFGCYTIWSAMAGLYTPLGIINSSHQPGLIPC